MKPTYIFICLVSLVSIHACSSTKKTQTAPQPVAPAVLTVPPLPIDTAQKMAESFKQEPYRGSNTRINALLHTRLEVNFDWTHCYLNGKATLTLKPYFNAVSMCYLNARGMEIKSLEVFESPVAPMQNKQGTGKNNERNVPLTKIIGASFEYENDSIKIKLGKVFTRNQTFVLVINYVAKPNELKNEGGSSAISDDKGLYFINPTSENIYKMPQIWTQGETQSNSVWFPTIDSPNEKMTQEILITVDDRFTTLSNGSLIASTKSGNGTRTDHWKLDQPHAPYLAMMAVGEFQKVVDTPWNGKEVSFYVERAYVPHAMGIFGDTREMIDFYSSKLGVPYPWPKYAQIVVRDYVSGAMENTSATLHGDFMVYQTTREMIDEKKGNDVIAHELFHQWFGDLVTCESWSNLPLNESFATYGEYLWEEYKNGRDAADYHSWQSRIGYIRSKNEANLIRFNYKDKEDMFDAISYNKGGQILHMLRKAVGDDAFFASLKLYLETNSYKSGEVQQLRLAFEEITGEDLNWFFNQWFLNKGRPSLKVTQRFDPSSNTLELHVDQKQDPTQNPLYRLPIELDVYVNDKVERTHIVIDDPREQYFIKTAGTPQLVNFDAERQLLCDLDYKKSTDEYVYQYKHAPLLMDRFEALQELESKLNEEAVFALFKLAALNDPYYALRNFAIQKLQKAPAEKLKEVKALYTAVFNKDPKTLTRAAALKALNTIDSFDSELQALNDKAMSDASYAVCAEGLKGLAQFNPPAALQKAKQFENESGKIILFALAELYANQGADEQMGFFQKSLVYFNGFELLGFLNSYVKVAKRCTQSSNVLIAAMDLENLHKGGSKFIKFSTNKGIKDLIAVWLTKETECKTKLENQKKEQKDTNVTEKELKQISETKSILSNMLARMK